MGVWGGILLVNFRWVIDLFWSLWGLICTLLLTLLFPRFFIFADAVIFYELMKSWKIPKDVDSSASIKMSGFQEPKIVAVKMAHGTRQLNRGTLLKIEWLKFRCLLVWTIFAISFIESRNTKLMHLLLRLFKQIRPLIFLGILPSLILGGIFALSCSTLAGVILILYIIISFLYSVYSINIRCFLIFITTDPL